MSRKKGINSIHIDPSKGDLLQILVEHLGRLVINETKGIIGNVTLNNKNIEQWSVTSFPFANFTGLKNLLSTLQHNKQDDGTLQKMNQTSEQFSNEPIIFDGTFDIENDPIRDTFIDTRGWGKVCHSQTKHYATFPYLIIFLSHLQFNPGIYLYKWF